MTLPTPVRAATFAATPRDDTAWLQRLQRDHDAELDTLRDLLSYYAGTQRLSYMHPELLDLIGDRVRQLVVNWPRLVVDALDERVDLRGFRLGGSSETDEELGKVLRYNDLHVGYHQAHTTAMIMRRAYTIVGRNDADPRYPLVSVESPLTVHVDLDPYTHRVRAALKRWADPGLLNDIASTPRFATLYRPDHTTYFMTLAGGYEPVLTVANPLGRVLVHPIVNRPTTWAPLGVSELTDIIPISDAACKTATDMMVSGEFHAMPRRYALGFDEDDFTDKSGNPLSTWQTIAGKIWATIKNKKDDGVEVGQFPEADLRNFHDTLRALAIQVGAVSGLPMYNLGYSSDNPASAEGINAAAQRHIKVAERRMSGFAQGWQATARSIMEVRDGALPDDARFLEAVWADASTPTFAAKADAVVKLYAQDHLVPRRTARKTLGYTDAQIKDMEAEDRADAQRALTDPTALFATKPERDVPERLNEAAGSGSGAEPPPSAS